MRALIGIGLGLVLSCGVTTAAQPPDAKKLIGLWEQPADKETKRMKVTLEFDATKATMMFNDDNNLIFITTYKVEGKKILMLTKAREGDRTQTFQILKLTDDVLDMQDEDGMKLNFKRAKAESKKDR